MWRPPTACPVLFMKVLVKVWFTTGLPCASPKVRINTSPNPTNTEVVFGFFIDLFFLCLFLFFVRHSRLTGLSWFFWHNRSCYSSVHCFLKETRDAVTPNVKLSWTRRRMIAPQASRL